MSHSPSPLYAQVVAALQKVYDPELPVDIYGLGLIYKIDVKEKTGQVAILMTLTTPNCPAAELIPEEIKKEVGALKGVRRVDVKITFDPPYHPARMSEEAKASLGWLDMSFPQSGETTT